MIFWAKSRTGRLIEGAAWALDAAIGIGLISGAVVAAVLGKALLGAILALVALVALGVFLRFKRRQSKSKVAEAK